MYLMYIDESGDVGQINSPTRFFILSAIVIHESKWVLFIDQLNRFRKYLKVKYGLLINEEIHSSHFISGRNALKGTINRINRGRILAECIKFLKTRSYISIITVRNDKSRASTDIFKFTWETLIQRFENTMQSSNFPLPENVNPDEFSIHQRGLIISDNTDGGKLRKLLRKMRHINNIPSMFGTPSRNIPLEMIVEDPILRDSASSNIHQMVDVVAYFAKQVYDPNSFILRVNCQNHYGDLMPVINPYATIGTTTSFKIVEI